jgi:hypothetical protein
VSSSPYEESRFTLWLIVGAILALYAGLIWSCWNDCEARGGQPVLDGAGLITCVERK